MYVLGIGLSHDSSAVLLHDGQLVAAVEEERLNRVKHCDYPPIRASRYCLEHAGIDLAEVDIIAVGSDLDFIDDKLFEQVVLHPSFPVHSDMRSLLAAAFHRFFGVEVTDRLVAVEHHHAHAASAYGLSGFSEALIVTLDGGGDGVSGIAMTGHGKVLEEIDRIRPRRSLGHLYTLITNVLGYRLHDEYKVMGLSSHGDAERFGPLFERFVELAPDGSFTIDRWGVARALAQHVAPRRRGEALTEDHNDIAAALQQTTGRIVAHYLAHLAQTTGMRQLCYAGGVAHNCAVNGQLALTGPFERMFVQPAASDAGLACGAAFAAYWDAPGVAFDNRRQPMIYLGPDIGTAAQLEPRLARWDRFVTHERCDDICARTAALLAQDKVVGWAQGRCEFGPRALGNRSILADPRPANNRSRINHMVKKREDFRPFAPAVQQEHAREYFELPPTQDNFAHMSVALPVQPAHRAGLGAVTHVDGTARVQTVSAEDNPRFHRLIGEFARLTGTPVVLNTSFNNHREPIVTTIDDALITFLTTELDALVVDDLLIRKRSADVPPALVATMYVAIAFEAQLSLQRGEKSLGERPVSSTVFELLTEADGFHTVEALHHGGRARANGDDLPRTCEALLELWSERLIRLSPDPQPVEDDTVPRPWLGRWA